MHDFQQRNIPRAAPSSQQTAPHPTEPTAQKHPRQKPARRLRGVAYVIVALVSLPAFVLGGLWLSHLDVFTGVESNHYQAVFLTNGEIYFGKLRYTLTGQARLTDIYYIKKPSTTATSDTKASSDQAIELVKLGKELHGPRDNMIISNYQLLYFENLSDDSQVVKTIEKDKGDR